MTPSARKDLSNLLEEGTVPEWLGEHRTEHVPPTENARDEQYGRWSVEAGKAASSNASITGSREVTMRSRPPALPARYCWPDLDSLGGFVCPSSLAVWVTMRCVSQYGSSARHRGATTIVSGQEGAKIDPLLPSWTFRW